MKVIVTVLGKDKPGIISKVSTALYAANANILDISQTVLRDEVFAMTMLVDLLGAVKSFAEIKTALHSCADEMGMEINVQREEIFDSMHRV